MNARWDGPCPCGRGDVRAPYQFLCRACLDEDDARRLRAQAQIDLAKHAAKHAEKGTR